MMFFPNLIYIREIKDNKLDWLITHITIIMCVNRDNKLIIMCNSSLVSV